MASRNTTAFTYCAGSLDASEIATFPAQSMRNSRMYRGHFFVPLSLIFWTRSELLNDRICQGRLIGLAPHCMAAF
jgi:hypothetical protein